MSRPTTNLGEAFRVVIPLAILAVGVGGFLVLGRPPQPPAEVEHAARPAPVQVVTAKAFTGSFDLDVDGVAVPFRTITLSAEVDGRIVEKSPRCRGGHVISPDDELLVVDPTDYKLSVDRLLAQHKQATEELASVDVDIKNTKALIALAEEDLELLKKELAKSRRLAATSAISESTLDETRRQELSGRNTLQTLRNQAAALEKQRGVLQAKLELAGVDLEQAREVLKRTRIRSSIVGAVIDSPVEVNDYVRKGDPLVNISATKAMEVRCNLRIDQLYWVLLSGARLAESPSPGDVTSVISREAATTRAQLAMPPLPVEVSFDFEGTEIVWEGVLSRYEGTGIDLQTRTVPIRVLVADPVAARSDPPLPSSITPRLYSGMYVRIRIPIEPPVQLLELPDEALRPGGQVWTAQGGKLSILAAEAAHSQKSRVFIRRDSTALQPGDQVVVSPLAAVSEGMPVEAQEGATQ